MSIAAAPLSPDQTQGLQSLGLRAAQGEATIAFEHINHRTVAIHAQATSPLRLISPQNAGNAAWLFTSTFGGGLLAGDHISLDIHAGTDTTAYLSSQSSTKIYRSADGRSARQSLRATLAERSLLILAPDPVACFADARYQQTQRFDMPASAGLILLDWFTSGRHAPPRSERWQTADLRAQNEIFIDNKRILTDNLYLSADDGPLAGPFRMAHYNCFATLILLGHRVHPFAQQLLQQIAAIPIRKSDPMPVAASPLADGLILRLAAPSTEHATHFLLHHLAFLSDLLGEHPWTRKR